MTPATPPRGEKIVGDMDSPTGRDARHAHDDDHEDDPLGDDPLDGEEPVEGPGLPSPITLVHLAIAIVAVATVIGAVLLWPRGAAPELGANEADLAHLRATVTDRREGTCLDAGEGIDLPCQFVEARLLGGDRDGEAISFRSSVADRRVPTLDPGDRVIVTEAPFAPEEYRYSFFDFERRTPMLALAVVFVIAVVAFGRWKGVRALAGLVASLAIIVVFLLPALIRGNQAIAVALVATSAIAFVALYLAHGVNASTSVALAGTLVSVAVITALAGFVSVAARLTGLSDESLQTLSVTASAIDPRAILLAGIVIGALGVLDDVTVTQVSAVAELRRANPDLDGRALYGAAVRIGRDHIASTVNTLVLAYVGASLSLVLFFFQQGQPVERILTGEVVAIEVVRTLVGSIGLVLAVPVTTALAVVVSTSTDLEADHGHSHGGGHGHVVDRGVGGGDHRAAEPADDDLFVGGAAEPSRPPRWEDFAPEEGDRL